MQRGAVVIACYLQRAVLKQEEAHGTAMGQLGGNSASQRRLRELDRFRLSAPAR